MSNYDKVVLVASEVLVFFEIGFGVGVLVVRDHDDYLALEILAFDGLGAMSYELSPYKPLDYDLVRSLLGW